MNLSKHVTVAEFEASGTAIARSIPNKMNEFEIERAKLLCENVFEPLRAYLNTPIKINSGYRNIATNRACGGSRTSQHCMAEAMDVNIGAKGFNYIKDNLVFDQLIWEFGTDKEPAWVHVSYKKTNNRKQVLKATKKNGKTIYTSY
jgi:zinc D-Ala-D-Ala carboxypeptidase